MEPEKLPFYLRQLGTTLENKLSDALKDRDKKDGEGDASGRRGEMPPMRGENMDFLEPEWDEIDKKANLIVARYAVIAAASNILPFGFDVVAVTAVFTKLTTELAGVYQVIVSNKRARQMSWAIATTTGTVLGVAYAGSRLAKFIPGGYFVGVAVQAPIVGAAAWAAGDTLKDYFKQTRLGREPSLDALRDSFAHTLRLRLKTVKADKVEEPAKAVELAAPILATTTASAPAAPSTVSDVIEKIAALHELLRAGAITQAEFDAKKVDLLAKL